MVDSVNFNLDDNKPFIMRESDNEIPAKDGLPKEAMASNVTVTVYGYIYFLDSDNNWHPFVNSRVEIWDDDVAFDDYLGSTTTNANGYFSKSVSGGDGLFDDEIEVYLQLKAQNSKVKVYEPISAEPYRWLTNYIETDGGNVNFGNVGINVGGYGACSIFHWMNESWNFTATNGYDPGEIVSLWPNSDGTYYSLGGAIYIESSYWHWDAEDVTRHEYGHNLMYYAQSKWWPSHTGGTHSFYDVLHKNFAWTEGWATAFAQFVDTDGTYNSGSWSFPIENQSGLGLPEGYTNEARVASSLSDLYDFNVDGDDYVGISYDDIISTIRDHNNDDLIEFWNNLKNDLSQSDKHYGSRALIYNTIDVPLELYATISGLSYLGYKENGTFTANVSGGSGSISYQWYKKYEGSSTWQALGTFQSQVIKMVTTSFTVKVVVTRGSEIVEATAYCSYLINEEKVCLPDFYYLSQNSPNPFNLSTKICYFIPEASNINIMIYDLSGILVREWIIENEQPGYKSVFWDGRNANGQLVSTGLYICQLIARGFTNNEYHNLSRKMILVK
ncbi:MAG TPA: FlgD immunoglobulin-like domain containing protein [Candidatus Marinimicrobia bacterium]|nr:FlgD immunoglobulin-like domain containing protein [Candidatus Neomarinimicrobiota bacterium]HQE95582.1 FlgD immunoglobulin-like domain containing protein [Candidatus Neomarinimicrobiota bacterium]HQH56898.1 FlgD immunoglobulin-like domain containing protein [Candidatus Neomarinimicrobiota bacterium]